MCDVKYNYSTMIVFFKPGEMSAALNKFFTPRHYKMNRQAPAKNLGVLIEGLLLLRFDDC